MVASSGKETNSWFLLDRVPSKTCKLNLWRNRYYDDISGNYAMLSSRIAKDSGMGVLAVDYRTTDSNNPHRFPEAIHDVIDGFEWLKSMGASELYLYGACVFALESLSSRCW